MNERSIQRVVVCGAGTMGSGIAQVAADAGYPTVLYDLSEEAAGRGRQRIEEGLLQLQQKGKRSPERVAEILSLIETTTDRARCTGDLIIEAVVEQYAAKENLLGDLAARNGPDTVLASNTSSLSITRLAAALPGPGRVAGLHFFNPAPVMKLVEIVRGAETSEDTVGRLRAFVQSIQKTGVVCRDAPGFIVNRVARPFYIESLRLAEGGVAPEQLDRLLQNAGFRLGPFQLMDLIGNDINYAVSGSVWEQLGQPERLRPSPLQEALVRSGKLGRKTGKGYYDYGK